MPKPENAILMGVIGAAHGIKGELRVKSYTGDPLALGDYGPLFTRDGRAFEVADIRPAGTVVVVRFKGIDDRTTAETLTGTELFVDRAVLPAAGGADEFYHADLIGLSVTDETGAALGKVTAVQNYGGGDILELSLGGRQGVLIPFTEAAVPEVDIGGGFIRIDAAAAGLTEDEEGMPDRPRPGRGGFDPKRRPRGPREAGGNR